MTDRELDLERQPKPHVARDSVEKLTPSTGVALAEYAVRMGLGAHFASVGDDVVTRDVEPTGDDLGALLAIPFDGRSDPAHADLYDTLTEYVRDGQPEVIPDECPSCGSPWFTVRVRWKGQGPTQHATPVECDECGRTIEPGDAPVVSAGDDLDLDRGTDEYSLSWGSGAVSEDDDVEQPPARGARRCDECDEWTSERADECTRCGGDPYADSRDDELF